MNILKVLSHTFLTLLGLFIIFLAYHFRSDIPVKELKEKYTYHDSKFLNIEGLEVHYRDIGAGDPLVLLHGTGASLHTWETWIRELKKDFRVIAVDLPAYGITGPSIDHDYSIDGYCGFLDLFTQKINLDSFHLAGNSLGGYIAWQYAYRNPDKVKKLVLINAAGFPQNKKEDRLAFKLAKNATIGPWIEKITPKSFVENSLKDVYHDPSKLKRENIDRYYDLLLREGNRKAFAERLKIKYKDDSNLIRRITNPTLILWGKHDRWIPVENAYKFKEAIEYSSLIIYENAGHVPMEEIPNQSLEDTRKWLLDSAKKE